MFIWKMEEFGFLTRSTFHQVNLTCPLNSKLAHESGVLDVLKETLVRFCAAQLSSDKSSSVHFLWLLPHCPCSRFAKWVWQSVKRRRTVGIFLWQKQIRNWIQKIVAAAEWEGKRQINLNSWRWHELDGSPLSPSVTWSKQPKFRPEKSHEIWQLRHFPANLMEQEKICKA